eukprot:126107_1
MISFKQDTSESIIAHATVTVVAVIANLLILLLLVRHLRHKQLQYASLKVLSVVSVVLCVLAPSMQCAMLNSTTLPSLHNLIDLVGNHCSTLLISFAWLAAFCKYIIWLFLLSKIAVFFKDTPFKLSTRAFYAHIAVYTLISVGIVYISSMRLEPLIYLGSEGTSHKLCFSSPPTEGNRTEFIFLVTLYDGRLIEMVLLYLSYSKAKRLGAHQTNEAELSLYFSQRDKALIDIKLIKRCCAVGVVSIVVSCVWTLCVSLYDKMYLCQMSMAFAALPVICSFDIDVNVCDTTNDAVIEEQVQAEMMERQEKYLRKLMNEYYKVPPRRTLQQKVSIQLGASNQ